MLNNRFAYWPPTMTMMIPYGDKDFLIGWVGGWWATPFPGLLTGYSLADFPLQQSSSETFLYLQREICSLRMRCLNKCRCLLGSCRDRVLDETLKRVHLNCLNIERKVYWLHSLNCDSVFGKWRKIILRIFLKYALSFIKILESQSKF